MVLNEESSSFRWCTPVEALKDFVDKKVKLAPPQFIMLNILTSFTKYAKFSEFLHKCNANWINMGPNIVSMINNPERSKQEYPYAATLLGDSEFPFDFCTSNEKNEYLIQ